MRFSKVASGNRATTGAPRSCYRKKYQLQVRSLIDGEAVAYDNNGVAVFAASSQRGPPPLSDERVSAGLPSRSDANSPTVKTLSGRPTLPPSVGSPVRTQRRAPGAREHCRAGRSAGLSGSTKLSPRRQRAFFMRCLLCATGAASAALSGGFAGQRLRARSLPSGGQRVSGRQARHSPFRSDGGAFGRTRCRRRNWMLL